MRALPYLTIELGDVRGQYETGVVPQVRCDAKLSGWGVTQRWTVCRFTIREAFFTAIFLGAPSSSHNFLITGIVA